MQIIWNRDFPLRVYEVGPDGHVSLVNIMNFFQDSAAAHAAHLGVGFPQLSLRNMAWFVTKYHVKVRRYPVYGETVRVTTWPKSKKRLFAIRDFEMRVEEEIIAAGSSVWCLVDLETRKPLNVNETLPGLPENPQNAITTTFPRVNQLEQTDFKKPFSPRLSEVDMNGHVNNTALIGWAVECLPSSFTENHSVSEMAVFFKNEVSRDGDVISAASIEEKENHAETIHLLPAKETGREILRMKLKWEAAPGRE